MSEWTILCPGHSLNGYDGRTTGPVVAVNSAVLSGHRFDIWCCQDGPQAFRPELEFLPKGHLIWCTDMSEGKWADIGMRTWPHPSDNVEFIEEFVPDPVPEFRYRRLSVLVAVSRALHYGAEKINLHGCDMEGHGYSYGTDFRSRTEEQWAIRWNEERDQVLSAFSRWESQGVEIDRKEALVE